jgi:methionine-rich copper-binding protein CopC
MKKIRALLLLVLSIPLITTSGLPAQAHTSLELSTPSDNQSIEFMPTELSASFDEDLISIEGESVNTLTLKGADGTSYELLPPTMGGAVLSAQVADGEYPAGDYLLSYRAVSADGHPIKGEITFSTKSSTMVESAPATPVTTSLPAEPEDSTFGSSLALMISLAIVFAVVFGIKRKYGSWQK